MDTVICRTCADGCWVCENHRDRPWAGTASVDGSCGCGAGAPCGSCQLRFASVGYTEPYRRLADKAISYVEDAERETNWGSPTFGPTPSEELRAEYDAIASAIEAPSGDETADAGSTVGDSAGRQASPNPTHLTEGN